MNICLIWTDIRRAPIGKLRALTRNEIPVFFSFFLSQFKVAPSLFTLSARRQQVSLTCSVLYCTIVHYASKYLLPKAQRRHVEDRGGKWSLLTSCSSCSLCVTCMTSSSVPRPLDCECMTPVTPDQACPACLRCASPKQEWAWPRTHPPRHPPPNFLAWSNLPYSKPR